MNRREFIVSLAAAGAAAALPLPVPADAIEVNMSTAAASPSMTVSWQSQDEFCRWSEFIPGVPVEEGQLVPVPPFPDGARAIRPVFTVAGYDAGCRISLGTA